ncbi:phosphoenolpyruvate--protein phosphotransferase [Pseudonocardia sp. GCM10023141]|uniref:phosphoenolpyruvate--protein phosphotransferase n=1 Tax=Pseudonocardia sp. GCM10023141 TaxID=3252653 RepID=UPI0036160908
MIGLVVVSHSHALATAAVALAREMAPGEPPIEIAAGLDAHAFGTDAVAIAAAITAADRGDGVVVLMDLGSAVLSAELALELLDDPGRALLCPAPLVEGLVVAAVSAAGGASRAEVAAEAADALAGKLAQLAPPAEPGTGAETAPAVRGAFVVADPHGLHARPAARLVTLVRSLEGAEVRLRNTTTGSGWVPGASLSRIATLSALQGHEIEVAASTADALASVLAMMGAAVGGAPPSPPAAGGPVGASPGIAVGRAFAVRQPAVVIPQAPAGDPTAEQAGLDAARDAVRAEIGASATVAGAEIFDAHLQLLDDPALLDPTAAAIAAGASAGRAWADAVHAAAAAFDALPDAYLAARAADVRAVGDQVLRALVGAPTGLGQVPAGAVLVAPDLTPAEAALLDPAVTAGVVLAGGSATAHSAILLRSRAVPAVLGAGPDVLAVPDGTLLALDGTTGELVIDPSATEAATFRARSGAARARARAAAQHAGESAVTRDGVQVLVGANVAATTDPVGGADLVGLLRTEFLFLGRAAAPDVDEQVAAYREVAAAAGGRRVTLRTLDVGGDKPLPYLPLPAEANPYLGLRGIRLARRRPDLLADQLLAAVRVAHESPMSIMFPMVAVLDELFTARAALDAAIVADGRGTPAGLEVGIMVEVPATALKAAAFAPHVDFFSIGTNDLTQYALAAERGNAAVADLADAVDPGVLRLVDAVCRAAGERALVAVCGEAAADPLAAALFVGLGVRELSVTPPAVAATKQEVRTLDAAECAHRAAAALTAPSAAAVRAAH